jgi:hypothetical protein
MDYSNSVTVLRKYADMLDAQNTVQEAKEVDESEEQVEEGTLPPALQAHIDAKKGKEVDESNDEDESKDEVDESKDEEVVDEAKEDDESKDEVDESKEGQWQPSPDQSAQTLLRKYSDMVSEASKEKEDEVREEKDDDKE